MPPVDKVGLPIFPYHPDPLATGSVRAGPGRCACCGRERGYVYTATVYGENDLEGQLCPWCIADGGAAEKYGATFTDDASLRKVGIPDSVIEEVTRRTPGFNSWGRGEWLACCDDACEYHGGPTRQHLAMLDPTAVSQFLTATGWTPEQWQEFSATYEPGGNPEVYHFVCRACQKDKFGLDSN